MSKITENSLQTILEQQQPEKSWWNRPLWGKQSFLEKILLKFSKPPVSESAIFLHNREMMDARVFAKTAQAIDNDKFNSKEFLLFIKINYYLVKGLEEYVGLYQSVRLLQVAIEAKNSFLTIDQTEFRYRSSKQQEFYQYVEDLLKNHEDKLAFREGVERKLAEVLLHIKTEEGKRALQAYAKELDHLAEHELGLKLLSLFKSYQLADYSILRIISDLVNSLREKDLRDIKGLTSLVMVNYDVFDKLKQIIGISDKKSSPDTYALMIQYIALQYRHQHSYLKFQELIAVMRKWFKPYQAILGIRQEYSPHEYRQPKDFSAEIPGLAIYEKYQKRLTDQKTGYIYVEFGEEI
jgi:hypothetical protein